jgi:hypothetical protein
MKMGKFRGALLVFGLAGWAHAITVPPDPTLPGLAGVWAGSALDGWEFYRLELKESGSGVLTVQELPGAPIKAYWVRNTTLDQDEATFVVQSADGEAEPISVRSDGILPWRLTLRITATSGEWKRQAMLFRLNVLMERIDSLNKRAEELRRGKQ